MSLETESYAPTDINWSSRLAKITISILLGIVLFSVIVATITLGIEIYFADRIFPGVSIAGVDLSGLQRAEAATLLSEHLRFTTEGRLLLRDGDELWLAVPAEVGYFLNPEASAESAFSIGHQGGFFTRLSEQINLWYTPRDLPPVMVFDGRSAQTYLESIAEQINKPTIEAALSQNGMEIIVRSGQIGRMLDIPTTIEIIKKQFEFLLDSDLPLIVTETPPIVLDVSEQAEIAREILSAPMVLNIPNASESDPGPWTFDQETLAGMLAIQMVPSGDGARYQVGVSSTSLISFLESIAPDLSLDPVNARFYFNDDTRELDLIESATIGRVLNIEESVNFINQQLGAGKHNIELVFDLTPPEITDETTAEELGITEAVSVQSSYFFGSSSARMHNIQTASANFHGLFIAPGETFSMADVLGDVSLDTGYREALIIFGDRTIQGVGGGVCQVSTTLFRTVFFGGFPIVERYPHAYRVYYYELNSGGGVNRNLAGLDATVYVPLVDFKFTNDTQYWILMETYVNISARRLTWKFYSTSDGREVAWETSGLQNIVEPPEPLYQENPDLDRGEIEQVDWAVEGADVTVTRDVYRDGELILHDVFRTHYEPWRAVYEYGPGTKDIPTPAPTSRPEG